MKRRTFHAFEVDPSIPKADIEAVGIVAITTTAAGKETRIKGWTVDGKNRKGVTGISSRGLGGWSPDELRTIADLHSQGKIQLPIIGHS